MLDGAEIVHTFVLPCTVDMNTSSGVDFQHVSRLKCERMTTFSNILHKKFNLQLIWTKLALERFLQKHTCCQGTSTSMHEVHDGQVVD